MGPVIVQCTDSVVFPAVFITRRCDHRPISCARSAVRLLGLFVARCALVRKGNTTNANIVRVADQLLHQVSQRPRRVATTHRYNLNYMARLNRLIYDLVYASCRILVTAGQIRCR